MRQVSNDIAHDLRTPLGRLRQRLETARANAESLADYERAVEKALADLDGTLATFGALLRIAQIESGSPRAAFGEVDLSGLLVHLASTYSAVAEDCGKQISNRIADGVKVRADRELLTQMFVNVIENALHHSAPGAVVQIELRDSEDAPVVVIADDGPGIPSEEREKVFRRFYRLDRSRSTPGNGLGLALVAAIAQLHKIHIALADCEPGTRVTFEFGASPAAYRLGGGK
jgi:signal transduction histidine kinase